IEESDVGVTYVRVVGRRARPRLDGEEAVDVEPGRGTRRNRLVEPIGVVENTVLLPVCANGAADSLILRRAQAQLVALVRVSLVLVPRRTRRVALARGRGGTRIARALVIVAVHAARVVGVVLHLLDVADQVGATADKLQVTRLYT